MVHELKLGIGEKSSSDRTVMDRHPVPTDCPLLASRASSKVTAIGERPAISLDAQPHVTLENLANAF